MTFFLVIHVQVSRAGELHQKKFRRFIPKNLEGLFDPETKWSPLSSLEVCIELFYLLQIV